MKNVKYGLYRRMEPPIEQYPFESERSFLFPVVIGSLMSAVLFLGLFVLFF